MLFLNYRDEIGLWICKEIFDSFREAFFFKSKVYNKLDRFLSLKKHYFVDHFRFEDW